MIKFQNFYLARLALGAGLSLSAITFAGGADSWDLSPIISQMRWKLQDQDYNTGLPQARRDWLSASPDELKRRVAESQEKRSRPGETLQATVMSLLAQGGKKERQTAIDMLHAQIALTPPGNLDEIITDHGVEYVGVLNRHESGNKVFEVTGPNPQRMSVLNARDLACEYALLYLATGNREMADRAKDILLRFATVMPGWPRYDRDNKMRPQSDEAALRSGGPNGLWSEWYPLDLAESIPLLRAYDILRPLLTPEEKERIKGALVHHKEFIDRFDGGWPWENYNNLSPIHLVILFRFAQVLEKPEYVHQLVSYWDNLLRYAYTPDGFWKELTPDYDQGVTTRLMGTLPELLKGYSDPPGYYDPVTGERFDSLDLGKMAEARFERMRRGFGVLGMPDGKVVTLNDAWPGTRSLPADSPVAPGAPGLLGVAGLAKLGSNGMSAFLQFEGTHGHEHHDALNLVWYAAGREVFGETGYQALPGSGSSRWWHTITASHNTVAVNEMTQFQNELPQFQIKGPQVPEVGGNYHSRPPAKPDASEEIFAAFPAAGRYRNQGRLLIWDSDAPEAQAMEAEQENAYPGLTSLYRRTVVMVPLETGEGYLVDIFRIKGGKTHDFFLRGGLDWPYVMTFDTPLEAANQTMYKYIKIVKEGLITPPLLVKTTYEDNGPVVLSRLANAFGSPAELRLFVGEAPAIRRMGQATFSFVRRSAADPKSPLETCLVWVHEATVGTPKIKKVEAFHHGLDVAITVQMGDRTDTILSGISDESIFQQNGLKFIGKLALASEDPSGWKGRVFSGGDLFREKPSRGFVSFLARLFGRGAEHALLAAGKPILTGRVLRTSLRDQGDSKDALTVRLDATPDNATPKLAHIDLEDAIRISIPIKAFLPGRDTSEVILTHSPGFQLKDGRLVMTSFPGWSIFGNATVRLE